VYVKLCLYFSFINKGAIYRTLPPNWNILN